VAIRRKMTLAKSELVLIVSKYCLGNRSAKTDRVGAALSSLRAVQHPNCFTCRETGGLICQAEGPAKLSSFNRSPDLVSFNAGLQAVDLK
jgi:hypothetical protein